MIPGEIITAKGQIEINKGRSIRLQIRFVAREEVTSLAGLCILRQGKQGRKVHQNLVCMGHDILVVDEFGSSPVGEEAEKDEHDQRQGKAHADFLGDAHGCAPPPA